MNDTVSTPDKPRLTSLSHGGGCGCKIAPGVLSELLSHMPAAQPYAALLVGNETSDDAAVYQLNEQQALIATTDFFMPIVDDPYDFGRIAATNALSDVYAMGGTPIMALALVGMPINVLSKADIAGILQGGAAVCNQAGIPIAGGHSIDSVEPIYGLAAMGLAHPKHIKRNADAQAGDVLVLGKALGVGILSAALKKNILGDDGYRSMIDSTTQLNTPGAILGKLSGVHAITDVTGFGLLGHTLEVARASGLSARLRYSDLPWLEGVSEFAVQGVITGASGRNWDSIAESVSLSSQLNETMRALLCDPQTSGGLLVACAPEAVAEVLNIFHSEGFGHAAIVGELHSEGPLVQVEA
ncbi:selenide, water dikinase SelD [Paenalcaligenes niemegkensis]|uniref:selenide, water dikinase SelD n=1 Tax=Paenalcaligenes niemegkensis TaxID=2895469 RepID=UPI001EE9443D|nr:selenide, water dikinase SelD [Paenalcaligenes niemegkensis]MCQ9617569.1 selenide, water dikinase SelD [Paenalcaligenes niemegkensis]